MEEQPVLGKGALSPGAAPAVSPPRRGVGRRASSTAGRREETGGGSWRREEGGAGAPTESGWKVRFVEKWTCDTHLLLTRSPTPVSSPPPQAKSGNQVFGILEVLGRILIEEDRCVLGAETLVSPTGPFAFCLRVWYRAPRSVVVGESAHVELCSSSTAQRSVQGSVGVLRHNKPHLHLATEPHPSN